MTSMVKALVAELASDPDALAELAAALEPHVVAGQAEDGWMDSRAAAEYLGFGSTSPLKKLTASRSIPFEQDVAGGKCWFKRSDLDRWRRTGGATLTRV